MVKIPEGARTACEATLLLIIPVVKPRMVNPFFNFFEYFGVDLKWPSKSLKNCAEMFQYYNFFFKRI